MTDHNQAVISGEHWNDAPDAPTPKFEFDVDLPDHRGETLADLGGEIPRAFLCGAAGTGKTTLIRQKLLEDPSYGLVCATTGVAAVNLGGQTINSALGYATTETIFDAFSNGQLQRKMSEMKQAGYRWIICDEASMLSSKALSYIVWALRASNAMDQEPLGLLLVADFGQLPPIGDEIWKDGRPVIEKGKVKKYPAPWVFESEEWPGFEENMIKLEKIHRQSDQNFLKGINAIRAGRGGIGAGLLKHAGVAFRPRMDDQFDGTTIVATNLEVDRLNLARLIELEGKTFQLPNERWCAREAEPGEWKHIPEQLQLKLGAYVMILANNPPDFDYVNGDCGWVREYRPESGGVPATVGIELARNRNIVYVPKITRKVEQRAEPTAEERARDSRVRVEKFGSREKWILGELDFWPIRLAYATSTHKSQGLSLDRVQINPSHRFFGADNMAYVAVSRARTPEGLVIVGSPSDLANKVRVSKKVGKYL